MAKTTEEYCNKCGKITTHEYGIDRDAEGILFTLTCVSCGNVEEFPK